MGNDRIQALIDNDFAKTNGALDRSKQIKEVLFYLNKQYNNILFSFQEHLNTWTEHFIFMKLYEEATILRFLLFIWS